MNLFCKLFMAAFVIVLLSSCNENKKVFYIKDKEETGLKEGDPVVINGFKIGDVTKLYLTHDFQSLVKIRITENINLPKRIRFTIGSADMLGDKNVTIIPAVDTGAAIHYGDTISLSALEQHSLIDSSLIDKVGQAVNSYFHPNREDSLVLEVKRLNKEVEELNRTLKNRH